MPHELTEANGRTAFVYNQERGNPWHRLGTPIQGYMTVDRALQLSQSNDHVTLEPIHVFDEDGMPRLVPNRLATYSSIYGPMGVVGENWEVQQRSDLMALALAIVGVSEGEAVVDTMGNLGEHGERFFAHVEVPELVIDPNGVADTIKRGLLVATSFDGSMANTIGYVYVRAVCSNTVKAGLNGMTQAIKVKHTTNAEKRIYEAAAALEYAAVLDKLLVQEAERMLAVPGKPALQTALQLLWPIDEDTDPKWVDRRQETHDDVWDLFYGDTNVGAVGENGWAAYGAVTEWLDHFRDVRGEDGLLQGDAAAKKRAEQTIVDDTHGVNKKKRAVAERILALA